MAYKMTRLGKFVRVGITSDGWLDIEYIDEDNQKDVDGVMLPPESIPKLLAYLERYVDSLSEVENVVA